MLARGQRPTQHTAGAFLDALKRNKQPDRCFSVFTEMMDSGVDLGDVCFNIVVSALVQVRTTAKHERGEGVVRRHLQLYEGITSSLVCVFIPTSFTAGHGFLHEGLRRV